MADEQQQQHGACLPVSSLPDLIKKLDSIVDILKSISSSEEHKKCEQLVQFAASDPVRTEVLRTLLRRQSTHDLVPRSYFPSDHDLPPPPGATGIGGGERKKRSSRQVLSKAKASSKASKPSKIKKSASYPKQLTKAVEDLNNKHGHSHTVPSKHLSATVSPDGEKTVAFSEGVASTTSPDEEKATASLGARKSELDEQTKEECEPVQPVQMFSVKLGQDETDSDCDDELAKETSPEADTEELLSVPEEDLEASESPNGESGTYE